MAFLEIFERNFVVKGNGDHIRGVKLPRQSKEACSRVPWSRNRIEWGLFGGRCAEREVHGQGSQFRAFKASSEDRQMLLPPLKYLDAEMGEI